MKIIAFLKKPVVYVPIVVVILVAGYFYFSDGNGLGPTMTVTPRDFIEKVAISGTVKAAEAVQLGFAQNGRVSGVYASVGQRVPAGALLAEVENGDLRAAVAQARAELTSAEAQLAALEGGTRPEQIAIDESQVAADKTAEVQAAHAVIDAIHNAYTQSDDAIHNKADPLFTNARTDPKFSLSLPDGALQASLENKRRLIEPVFTTWQKDVTAALSTGDLTSLENESAANLASITAILADANTALNEVLAGLGSSSLVSGYIANIAIARANVNAATAALTGAITSERSAAAILETAEKTLLLAQSGALPADIDAQVARVAAAEAAVQTAQAALVKTQVVSPFAGVVTQMDAKVGEIVSPGDSQIAMMSTGAFQIEVYVPEVSIADVKVGDIASTTLDAYGSSIDFPAKVISIDPAETDKNGVPTYKTTLQFLSEDARIRSGMTANVSIMTGEKSNALVLPSGAIGTDADGSYVSVVVDGAAVKRRVTRGGSTLAEVEIVSGLSAGDVVLLTPASP